MEPFNLNIMRKAPDTKVYRNKAKLLLFLGLGIAFFLMFFPFYWRDVEAGHLSLFKLEQVL